MSGILVARHFRPDQGRRLHERTGTMTVLALFLRRSEISLHHRAQSANGNQPSGIRQTGCNKPDRPHLACRHSKRCSWLPARASFDLWRNLFPLIIRTPYRRLRAGTLWCVMFTRCKLRNRSAYPKQRRWGGVEGETDTLAFPAEICAGR